MWKVVPNRRSNCIAPNPWYPSLHLTNPPTILSHSSLSNIYTHRIQTHQRRRKKIQTWKMGFVPFIKQNNGSCLKVKEQWLLWFLYVTELDPVFLSLQAFWSLWLRISERERGREGNSRWQWIFRKRCGGRESIAEITVCGGVMLKLWDERKRTASNLVSSIFYKILRGLSLSLSLRCLCVLYMFVLPMCVCAYL